MARQTLAIRQTRRPTPDPVPTTTPGGKPLPW